MSATPRLVLLLVLVLEPLLSGCDPVSTTPSIQSGASASPAAMAAPAPASSDGAASQARELRPALPPAPDPRDEKLRALEDAIASLGARSKQDLAAARAEDAAALEAARKDFAAQLEKLAQDGAETRAALEQARKTLDALRAASPLANLARDVPRVEGQVVSATRGKDGLVVVIDVGAKQGVEKGFEFTIAHGGRAVAKISVERVEPDISSGRVVYLKDGEAVSENDVATTRP